MTTEDTVPAPENSEAAKYRTRLRDAEAHRDTLTTTLAALRRAQADSMAESHGLKPKALWASGTDIDALLDDDGNVDPERVQAAVAEAASTLGIQPRTRRTNIDGLRSGAAPPQPPPDTWREAFTPKR